MKKIGRNEQCRCGSGEKFKRCCGRITSQLSSVDEPISKFAHLALQDAMNIRQASQDRHRLNHGEVKEIISSRFRDFQIVASGSKIVYSRNWKVFPDFLNQHLHAILGKVWGEAQVKLPVEKQHPVAQWRTMIALASVSESAVRNELQLSTRGAANAWFRLAYDLYLLEHNASLRSRLIDRIREQDHFQGARFELAVAAIMLTAGYELTFCKEQGPGQHPEFIATHRESKHVIAIEAKSRHRPGIMGYKPEEHPTSFTSFNVRSILRKAIKDIVEPYPLLIFIELNAPLMLATTLEAQFRSELELEWMNVQDENWPKGFPAIGVVFYNDACSWYLNETIQTNKAPIWTYILRSKRCRENFEIEPLLKQIGTGCLQRCKIPLNFPDL